MNLSGKIAVVTGAAGGIGREIVAEFVSQGARVLAVDMEREAVDALAADYDGQALGAAADVTRYADVEAALELAVKHFGCVHIMINNAGIGLAKMLLEHEPEADFDPVVNVNQKGVYHGILAAGRKFRDLGVAGVILNTSSVYGQMAAEMTFAYNASKAAVDMMTKCAALEYAAHGIRVVAVAPGRVDTPMLRQYEALGLWQHIKREQMREEFTQPAEIASVFAYLASDAASCINGNTIAAEDGFLNFKYPLVPGA